MQLFRSQLNFIQIRTQDVNSMKTVLTPFYVWLHTIVLSCSTSHSNFLINDSIIFSEISANFQRSVQELNEHLPRNDTIISSTATYSPGVCKDWDKVNPEFS